MWNTRRLSLLALTTGLLAALVLLQTSEAQGRKQVVIRGGVAMGGPGGAVPATPAVNRNPNAFTDMITFDSKPEYRRYIKAAQDLIFKEKDWPKACEALQKILDNKKDFTVEITFKDPKTGQEFPRRVSVSFEANRLIGKMPKEGLETYQSLYGGRAQELLDEYKKTGDPATLAEVAHRYLHTSAGAEANELLATRWLDRGDYHAAAESFRRLLDLAKGEKKADKVGDLTWFKAAYAFRASGDAKSAAQVWKTLEPRIRRNGLAVGDQKVPADQLEKYLEDVKPAQTVSLTDWSMWRGNLARNAQADASAPLLEPSWQWSIIEDNFEEDNKNAHAATKEWVKAAVEALDKFQQPVLPGFFPVAANGKLVFRTYGDIVAVFVKSGEDAANGKYKAGELAWKSQTDGGLSSLLDESGYSQLLNQWKAQYAQSLQNLVLENSMVGTLSTDHGKVYAVDDLAVLPHPQWLQQWAWGGQPAYPGKFKELVDQNRLRAYDLESGKLVWELPQMKDNQVIAKHADLAETHFLGAPLPVGGKLYVVNEKKGELRLLVLNPGDGEVLRTQVLCNVKQPITRDTARRMHAVNLAYAEGILVIPTNAGAVLGVDLLTQTLIWAYPYLEDHVEQPTNVNGRFVGRGIVMQPNNPLTLNTGSEFKNSPPAVANGKVVFAAPDGQSIHCVDLRDGTRVWHVKRADDLYLAGVFNDRVLMVGKGGCRALRLADGSAAWAAETGTPTGQGVASKGVYYLPVKNKDRQGEVVALDLSRGTIRAHNRSRKADAPLPGNLLFHEGFLLSESVDHVTAYPQLEVREREISAKLKLEPQNPEWLTERGELLLADGKVRPAVDDLRKALRFKDDNTPKAVVEKARLKLYEAFEELFQMDFAGSSKKYLSEYRELCKADQPEEAGRRQARFLYQMGRGNEQEGNLLDAYQYYVDFAALPANKDKINTIEDPYLKAKPDVWVRGRIAAMMANAAPAKRKPLEDKIAQRWKAVRANYDLDAIRRFVETFDVSFVVGRQARLELAEALMEKNDRPAFLEAEKYLLQLRVADLKDDPATTGRALDALARLYIRQGTADSMRDAARLYRDLGRDYPRTVIRDGKTGADIFDELATDKRFLPYLDAEDVQQITGRIKARDLAANEVNAGNANLWRFQNSFTFEPDGDAAPFFKKHRLLFNLGTRQLNWVERDTGKDVWTTNLNLTDARYYNYLYPYNYYHQNSNARYRYYLVKGHLAVLQVGPMAFGLDLVNKKLLWEKSMLDQPVPSNNWNVSPDTDGTLQVVSYDNFTGQPFTRKIGMVGNLTASYVTVQTQKGLLVLDPISGKELWTKSDVPARTQVFGDDRYIYLIESRNGVVIGNARCLRASDGAKVEVPDFTTAYQNRLLVRDGKLLVKDTARKNLVLRLVEVRTGKDLWKKEYEADAVPLRSEDADLVGAVEPGGRVRVTDLRTLKDVLEARMEDADLKEVKEPLLLADRDQFYVVLNKPLVNNQVGGGVLYNNFSNGTRCAQVNGMVYAFDRKGRLRWHTFEPVANQMIVLEQFKTLPVLLFTVRYNQMNGVNGWQQWVVATRAIDKHTGKLLYDKKPWPYNGYQYYALNVSVKQGTVDLVGGMGGVRFYADDARNKEEAGKGGTGSTAPQNQPNGYGIGVRMVPAPAIKR